MHFDIDVHEWQVDSLLRRLMEINGPDPWIRKWRTLQQQVSQNPFLQKWHIERHGIELKLGQLLASEGLGRKFPIRPQDESQYELYGFSAGIVRIYEQLSEKGKARLRGMLRDGLQPDNNLLPLQHEIVTAVHLISRGYDVQMNDLENGCGVDFIALKAGIEIEVECKVFTADLGRKIHRNKVLMLHRYLVDIVQDIFKRATCGLLVRIEIPDRLTCQPTQLEAIRRSLNSAFLTGDLAVRSPECEVQVLDFDIQDSPFNVKTIEEIDQTKIRDFAHKKFNKANRELMMLFSPGKRAIVVQVQSAKNDELLKGAYRQLRESAKGQFTKTRPGILAVQFQELSGAELLDIARTDTSNKAKATGLQIMTSEFLNSPNRQHIHAVAYRSQGVISSTDGPHGSTTRSQGPAYYFRNPANPHFDDKRCFAFS